MTRRCSHCSHNGHNTRTCPTRGGGALASSASSSSLAGAGSPSASGGVKLFGVRLTDGSFIKKSASMGNLSSAFHHHHHTSNSDSPSSDHLKDPAEDGGYLSDDPNDHAGCSSSTGPRRAGERKKGVPWTEEEHRLFLIGLQKLGKGDWRGIARNFVVSRTPTQVASHAQKHFIRQSNASRRKRRSSLFDMVPEVKDPQPVQEEREKQSSQARETNKAYAIPSLDLSLKSEYEPMETASPEPVAEPDKSDMGSNEPEENFAGSNEFIPIIPTTSEYASFIPGFFPAYVPVPCSFWPANSLPHKEAMVPETSQHQVLRPVPILPKEPVNVDDLVGITHLSLGESERSQREPSPLSLKLVEEPSRQSAFHANAPVNTPELSKGKGNPIQAV